MTTTNNKALNGQAMIAELADACKDLGWTANEWIKYGKVRLYLNIAEFKDCKIHFDYNDIETAFTNTLDAKGWDWQLDRGAKLKVWHDNPNRRNEVWQHIQGALTTKTMNWAKQ